MTLIRMLTMSLVPVLLTTLAVAAPSRPPAVAGSFYPADAKILQATVDGFLAAAALPATEGELRALVVPHAGYVYSGPTAAHSYKRLRGSGIRRVILVGPAHRVPVSGAAIDAKGRWRTPLGEVAIDEALAGQLLAAAPGIGAASEPFVAEHSLEVQLPFLQRVLGEFTIVPVLIGTPTAATIQGLAAQIALLLRSDPGTLLVCSTDLSHYYSAATARGKDTRVIDAVRRIAVGELETLLRSREGEACGGWPLLLTMLAARGAGATNGNLFHYADSSAASGDTAKVVGYAAMGLYRTPLTKARGAELLRLARQAVAARVKGEALPEPACDDPRLAADGAAFVTLNDRNGQLRGCIGAILPVEPLCLSVRNNAVSAATRDPRFAPVRPEELPGLSIEVTVLSPLEPVNDPQQIIIGTHGVYLQARGTSSVFLPQVAPEQGWDLTTTLRQLARKAGLPPEGWRDGQLYRFTAEIVHEEKRGH